MLPFIRPDLHVLNPYTPHPGEMFGTEEITVDRVDTNESPYDLPRELKAKLAWAYEQEIETNRYPDGAQIGLKTAIAEYVNESLPQPLFDVAHISLGNGSDELIRSVLIATCLGGLGTILVANPTFSMYGILAQTLGIPVVTVNRSETNFEMDLTAAQAAIQSTQNPPVRVVFAVHPNSPTGNALTTAELDWLRNLPDHILVVIDEAYFEFSGTSIVKELTQKNNYVILRTFSKAFRLAGLRLGYAIANPELITILEKIRLPYNLPSFSQISAQLALRHRQELLATIPQTLSERSRLINAFTINPVLQVWPSDANFIYLRLQHASDPVLTQVVHQLKRLGTLVRQTGHGLRITIGSPEENSRTLNRLLSIISDFKP